MVDINLDFAVLIGSLTLVLAVIGYVFEIGYKNGYYQTAYLSDISTRNKLEHYALAIIISGPLIFLFFHSYYNYERIIPPILIDEYNSFFGSSDITFTINNTNYYLTQVIDIFLFFAYI